MATIDDFKKIELKVARIVEAEDHPNADRLYVLKVDLAGRTKQAVAGIKSSYKKEELIGRLVVFVDNLEPATLRGVESEGMVLAAQDDQGICIISPAREVKLGATVK